MSLAIVCAATAEAIHRRKIPNVSLQELQAVDVLRFFFFLRAIELRSRAARRN